LKKITSINPSWMGLDVAYRSHHGDCPVTRQDDILAALNFITKNFIIYS